MTEFIISVAATPLHQARGIPTYPAISTGRYQQQPLSVTASDTKVVVPGPPGCVCTCYTPFTINNDDRTKRRDARATLSTTAATVTANGAAAVALARTITGSHP